MSVQSLQLAGSSSHDIVIMAQRNLWLEFVVTELFHL